MKKLKHWDSGSKEEIRKIPVVCGSCGKEVSVGGWVQDNAITMENCPTCDEPIVCKMYSGVDDGTDDDGSEQKQAEYLITAEVTWAIQGGTAEPERTSKFGPMAPITSLLMSVLDSGVSYFAHSKTKPEFLFGAIADILVSNVLTLEYVETIFGICSKRLTAKESVEQFVVIETPTGEPGGNGTAKPPEENDKETDDDDE